MFPRFATPKTLTKAEQKRLLRAVRVHGSPRDRALLSPALSTGLDVTYIETRQLSEPSGSPLKLIRVERRIGGHPPDPRRDSRQRVRARMPIIVLPDRILRP